MDIPRLGRFEYNVLPFGLSNSSRTFQRILNKVLEGLIGIICFYYIDDIIIFSKTKETNLERLKIVMDHLRKANYNQQNVNNNPFWAYVTITETSFHIFITIMTDAQLPAYC